MIDANNQLRNARDYLGRLTISAVAGRFLDEVASLGIVHIFFIFGQNIFWIVMRCGIADFGRRGLKTP